MRDWLPDGRTFSSFAMAFWTPLDTSTVFASAVLVMAMSAAGLPFARVPTEPLGGP